MRRLTLLVGILVVLAACSAPSVSEPVAPAGRSASARPALSTGATTVQREVTVGGTRRSYLAVSPAVRRAGLPLLVMLHGRGIAAREEAERTGFVSYAERGLANIVYPVGIAESWNAGHGCCGAAGKEGVHDTAFITEVVTDASHYFRSDSRRIYLVGYSNGAKLSFEEVCEHPATFAALATYGAVPLATCADAKPISALLGTGTADPLVRAEHSSPSATAAVDQAAAQWRTRNGCIAPGTTSRVPPLTLTTWRGCEAGTEVASAIYGGVTHYWPTAAPTTAPFTTPVGAPAAAATVMWDFLSRHHLT